MKKKYLLPLVALLSLASCGESTSSEPVVSVEDVSKLLNEAKEKAKAEVNSVDENLYREKEQGKLFEIQDEAIKAIESATTVDEVNKALEKFKEELSTIKTDEQLSKEEEQAIKDVTLDEGKLNAIKGNIELSGTINERYGTADNISNLDIVFNKEAYYYLSENEGSKNEGNIFKIGGVPTIAGVNIQNQLVFQEMTDKEGNVRSWDDFSNPFASMSFYDFLETEEKGVYSIRHDTPSTESYLLNSFIPTITNYSFPSVAKCDITVSEGKVSNLYIESDVISTWMGDATLIADLSFVSSGSEVRTLSYPQVKETKPEHAKLLNALTEINTADTIVDIISESTSYSDDWDNAQSSHYKAYNSKTLSYLEDYNYGDVEGSGYILVDGAVYSMTYNYWKDETPNQYKREFYPMTDKNGNVKSNLDGARGDSLIAAPEYFTEVEENTFVCDDLTYAGTIAYYYSVMANPYAKASTSVTVKLNEEGHVSSISYSDGHFDRSTETYLVVGEGYADPFTSDQLIVKEDPFLVFVGTLTGSFTDKSSVEHTLSVTITADQNVKVTLDEVEQVTTSVSFDKKSSLDFVAGDYKYSMYKSSYSDYYSTSIYTASDNKYVTNAKLYKQA